MVIRPVQLPQAKKKPGGCLLSRRKGSIIGVRELDFRVRYGNGYFLSTMATGHISMSFRARSMRPLRPAAHAPACAKGKSRGTHPRNQQYGQASRPISNARLNASPRLHLHPIDRIVSPGSSGGTCPRGDLVLRWASRLDAFSGYPFRT